MRRFTIAGIFSLALVGMANAQFFDPPALADRNGSQGFWFYMLEVPDPGAITIDAHSDDWGWFDPEYTLTMDEWRGPRPRRPVHHHLHGLEGRRRQPLVLLLGSG
ncbi:MAG: hypothetical protein J4F35_12950 [Candidatus Latescibacteria bacterium]|nr:hypothetical protein [Candidatus Latescibacterota bacterium]